MKVIFGKKGLNTKEIEYLDEDDLFLPVGKSFWEKPIHFLNELTNKKIENTEFLELFNYFRNSLWWLILPTVAPSINGAINFIDKFEKMLKEKKPSSLYLTGEFDKITIIKQVCVKNGISFAYSTLGKLQFQIKKKLKCIIEPYRYKKITKSKSQHRKNIFNLMNRTVPSFSNKVVLFSATAYRRTRYDLKTESETRGESILEPIIEFLTEKKIPTVGIDVDYTFRGQFKILKERLNESIEWVPLETLQNKNNQNQVKNFLNDYSKIIKNPAFRKLFSFNRINFWDKIEFEFSKLSFLPYLPNYIELMTSLEELFTKQRPKMVILPFEKGSYGLIVIMVCKKLGIKTIAIQHGGIHLIQYIDYSYTNLQNDDNKFGLPLPDLTLVWGDLVKEFLMKKGYSSEQLSVFGNPEFFNFQNTLDYLKNNNFRKKFNIPENKKIILFTTGKLQSFYKVEGKRTYDEQVLKKLLDSYANNDEYYIILKPHPAHEPTHIYQKIIDSYNCNNFSIKQGNIFRMLQISDALISIESNTLLDSIAMGKLTFAVMFGGKAFSDYYEKNEVLLLTTLDSLPKLIDRSIYDNDLQEKLKQNQKKFIQENYNFPNNNSKEILSNIFNT